jgi:hypothetical protein
VFENRVLRRIFGQKGDEVTGGWRKLHNEEFQNLYSLPSINKMTKSRRKRLAEHVARMWITGMHVSPDDVRKRKYLTLSGLELRPLGDPARSQSLYRRYPGSF